MHINNTGCLAREKQPNLGQNKSTLRGGAYRIPTSGSSHTYYILCALNRSTEKQSEVFQSFIVAVQTFGSIFRVYLNLRQHGRAPEHTIKVLHSLFTRMTFLGTGFGPKNND